MRGDRLNNSPGEDHSEQIKNLLPRGETTDEGGGIRKVTGCPWNLYLAGIP